MNRPSLYFKMLFVEDTKQLIKIACRWRRKNGIGNCIFDYYLL